jgi:hypothetical protein
MTYTIEYTVEGIFNSYESFAEVIDYLTSKMDGVLDVHVESNVEPTVAYVVSGRTRREASDAHNAFNLVTDDIEANFEVITKLSLSITSTNH